MPDINHIQNFYKNNIDAIVDDNIWMPQGEELDLDISDIIIDPELISSNREINISLISYLDLEIEPTLIKSEEYDWLIPRIKRLNRNFPETMRKTFERHIWYSKFVLSHVYVYELISDEINTFNIRLRGEVNDGWEEDCCAFEVFDKQGNFLFSFSKARDRKLGFAEKQTNHKDYRGYPPPYPGDIWDDCLEEIWKPTPEIMDKIYQETNWKNYWNIIPLPMWVEDKKIKTKF